jgi:hypothetical protein
MRGIFQETARDPVPVPNGHETSVCKKGQGELTCSFLGLSSRDGHLVYECLKGSSLESAIRGRLREGSMKSKGDNCSGPPDFRAN